jgi:hypothetical protein
MEFQLLMRSFFKYLFLLTLVMLVACEKEITVDLPRTEPRVVVEASIETGQPPFVILTRTQNYFDPTSIESIAGSFISEADVRVHDGVSEHPLERICSSAIPPDLIDEIAAQTGFDPALLAAANICVWTLTDGTTLIGENGRSYRLTVVADGRTLTSTTTIPNPVQLDSLWFQLALQQPGDDSLGYIWTKLNDPDTMGNAYRWATKRLNRGDGRFVPPLFGVFEDRYINGIQNLPVNFFRGREPFGPDDDPEGGFFKRNDTVAFKFMSIGKREYDFFDSYANNVASDGDVFSTPANIKSNIDGGLGIWVGYGVFLDTLVCVPQ